SLSMHINQSLLKQGISCFSGDVDTGLSQTARYYIAGLITHGKALSAFTNPTASIRAPHGLRSKNQWIEARFPDPSANGYLALSATLMAGLDGIKRKLELDSPGIDYPFPAFLDEALNALDQDRAFLEEGDVFTDQMIGAYISLKRQEV
ncbi:MAG: glutamine synthetase, partial [Alphaproteobacteria bacterium]